MDGLNTKINKHAQKGKKLNKKIWKKFNFCFFFNKKNDNIINFAIQSDKKTKLKTYENDNIVDFAGSLEC